jgi:hypothetical protein
MLGTIWGCWISTKLVQPTEGEMRACTRVLADCCTDVVCILTHMCISRVLGCSGHCR